MDEKWEELSARVEKLEKGEQEKEDENT